MPLSAGDKLAQHEILSLLGVGGMGSVYKARDLQLGRLVALKILTPDKLTNEERKLRFVQEAKAASALNHPNIVTIHSIGNENGVDFIVMEYVAGFTLDHLIPRGGLKLIDVLKYGIQAADGLAAAHQAGIVHRDLKPGNIIVSEEGQVKLLDFGLAKLSDLHDAPDVELTRDVSPETQEGSILGTVSYMSPEQAEARRTDARSDIFSFGAVLYEMAVGQRAFVGRSKISTLAAILQSEPKPAEQLDAALPRDLAKLINRCLRKDPARRYQSAADLKISLSDILHEVESGDATPSEVALRVAPTPSSRPRFIIGAAGMALGLAAAAGAWWWSSWNASPVNTGPIKPLTTYAGHEAEPAISPDGKQIAFAWDGPGRDNFDIYVRLVDGGSPLRLTTAASPDHAPAWSPNGQRLAFFRDNAIYLIPSLGGVERRLLHFPKGSLFPNASSPSSLSWSPDGRFLVFNGAKEAGEPSTVWMVSTESGEHRRATNLPKAFLAEFSPAFSPDGQTLAFIRARDTYSRAVVLQAVDPEGAPRGPERELTSYDRRIEGLAWLPDSGGLILATRQMGERTRMFRLRLNGTQEPLGIDTGIVLWPTLSLAGNRMAYQKRLVDTNIYRMDGPGPDGGPRPYDETNAAPVIESTAHDREAQVSPDGRRLTFNSDRLGYYEMHVAGSDGTNQVALTGMGPTAMGSPRWSPDGQTIVFDRYENGNSTIYSVNAEGGKPRRITGEGFRDIRPSFSRDGKWIYFISNRGGGVDIWKVPASGGALEQLSRNSGNEPFESPDGKELYYVNSQGLWSQALSGGEPKLVLQEPVMLLYALAGRSVYYGVRNPPGLWVLRTDTGKKFEYTRFPKAAIGLDGGTVFSVSSDERSIYFSQTDRLESDLMLVENFR